MYYILGFAAVIIMVFLEISLSEILNPIQIFLIIVIFLLSIPLLKILRDTRKSVMKKSMKFKDMSIEFEKFYKNLYNDYMVSLEKIRKKLCFKIIIQYALVTFVVVLFIIGIAGTLNLEYQYSSTYEFSRICLACSICGFIFLYFFYNFFYQPYDEIEDYKNTYKTQIISKLIKLIDKEFKYINMPGNGFKKTSFSWVHYAKAKFDNKCKYSDFTEDDYIEKVIDNQIFITISNILLTKEYYMRVRYSILDIFFNRYRYIPNSNVFQGIFAYIKYPKDIGTHIKIKKKKVNLFKQNNIIKMDNYEFEKYFDVYSENKTISMKILTNDIMDILVKYHKEYDIDYEIVFKDDYIYMRFFTGPMLEPKIFGNSIDKQVLFSYYSVLKFIIEFISKITNIAKDLEI